MEDEAQDHLSDTLDHTLFPHLVQVGPMDLACPQEVTCLDHQVLWWWDIQVHTHVDPWGPWCVAICQALMVLQVLWGFQDPWERGSLWGNMTYHLHGMTGEEEGGHLANHYLSDNQVEKHQSPKSL